jgi:hypothetical protein
MYLAQYRVNCYNSNWVELPQIASFEFWIISNFSFFSLLASSCLGTLIVLVYFSIVVTLELLLLKRSRGSMCIFFSLHIVCAHKDEDVTLIQHILHNNLCMYNDLKLYWLQFLLNFSWIYVIIFNMLWCWVAQ